VRPSVFFVTACRLVAWSSVVLANAPILYHIARGSRAYLGLFADDFFYYCVLADNFVKSGNFTFDGTHPTNGFHPLWMIVLTLIRLVSGGGPAFFAVLAVVDTVLAGCTFELYAALGQALGARRAVSFVCAASMTSTLNAFFQQGMETNLAVPLGALFLLLVARTSSLTRGSAFRLGLVASLMTLARLDFALLPGLMTLAYLLGSRDAARDKVTYALAFGCGGLLVPLYLAFNLIEFGAFEPTSAIAKQLTTSFGVNGRFIGMLIGRGSRIEMCWRLVAVLAAAQLFRPGSFGLSRQGRFAAGLALAFPPLYFIIGSLRSPWWCFPWYAYPLFSAQFVGLVLVVHAFDERIRDRRIRWPAGAAAVGVLALMATLSVRAWRRNTAQWSIADNLLVANAVAIETAMRDRPGVYAMGDKAGSVSYLLERPIVQLEGLVSDRAMTERIRTQQPLERVLRDYGVDYLIVSAWDVPLSREGGCYSVWEPDVIQAGARSPKMHGSLCTAPLFYYQVPRGPHPWSLYNYPIYTYVFDVRSGA
jgi:hypothetical protein